MTSALLEEPDTARLRTALARYTVDSVHDLLGPVGHAALDRGDLAGVARSLGADTGRLATLIRLFMLGGEVDESHARAALAPFRIEAAAAAGFVRVSAGSVRAGLDVRPYAQRTTPPGIAPAPVSADDSQWWVVSDLGADVRGGPLDADHVLGIGAASLTLAQSTPRRPVNRALDVGTGCGIQALHLSTHAAAVTATDISPRALRLAATTAALSGVAWDLRHGSLLEPVAGERFDLIVANPPFVVSAGDGGYDYRDGGLSGDALCRTLVGSLAGALAEGGTAQLLANWIVPVDGSGPERLSSWFDGSGCDTWVWQRELASPAEYVTLWLRDAGEAPGTPRWTRQYDAWLDWFDSAGVAAVGMGLITMWHSGAASPAVVIEDVPQPVAQPAGGYIDGWVERRRLLAGLDDAALLDATWEAAPDVVLERADLLRPGAGWSTSTMRLRQSHELRWSVETDDSIAALVAACDGSTPLRTPIAILAAALSESAAELGDAVAPVVRDLVARGFLRPVGRPGAAGIDRSAGARRW